MNSVKFLGRTTSDIERKVTNSGKSVATFRLAVKRPFAKDVTDFFNLVAWEKTADMLSTYVTKGQQIVVEGYLTNRKYEAKDGSERTATEIIVERFHFCGSKNEQSDTGAVANNATTTAPESMPDFSDMDDDLPF